MSPVPIDERNFEDDVQRLMGEVGWRIHFAPDGSLGKENNRIAQRDYDRELALKVDSLIGFIQETQSDEWAKLEQAYGPLAKDEFLTRLAKELKLHGDRGGVVNVLRHGLRMVPNARFRLCYFRPASTKNPDAWSRYEANRFELVRQLRYGTLPSDKDNSLDVTLFLNGIPVVTMELKNSLTNQHTDCAVYQYKHNRDPKEPIFKPVRRSIVHFAVDTDTAEMCTWLRVEKSVFLPYNRGNGRNGGGNPPNPGGYRTEYLFTDVLAPVSLLDIIQRFVRVETDSRRGGLKRVIFPRYHQLDAVRKLVADAREKGSGESYLVQHSAGSGKSYTIAWLAHHLQSLHDDADRPIFDSVIVLTDRRNLDAQLSQTVDSIEHKSGVVRTVREEDGSAGLRDALNSGAKIITTTIQKFPYIFQETKVTGRRFAVIIDEAHSSQSGRASAKMRLALADTGAEGEDWDTEDEIALQMKVQGRIPNLSFFAFTATPKATTLEVFGTRDAACAVDGDGHPIPRPFHIYSMKQAIDEGFILDVLENYTCYQSYFGLVKTIADDPRYGEVKANAALRAIAEGDPAMVGRKARIIVEHFMNDVEGLLDGRAKAMVVTWSRTMAYELYLAMRGYVAERGYACEVMVAFSGALKGEHEGVTEAQANGFPDSRTAEVFAEDAKRIIVCANKFQTGFDQPKLCAMYVDKGLTGVAAVQTLSRLNRIYPGKRTFVLDFANDWDTIRASFANYYEATELDAATDPNVIYDLKARLDGFYVYEGVEVEGVVEAYLDIEHPELGERRIESLLQPAVDRWVLMEDEAKRDFKALLRKFLRNYSFITQMVSLGDHELHRFFVYGGLLVKKLRLEVSSIPDLRDKVQLEYLRIEDKGTRAIKLEAETLHNGGANAGVSREEDEERLSVLVQHLNEAFGTDWQQADKVLNAAQDIICEDEEFVQRARHNGLESVRAIFGDVVMRAISVLVSEGSDMRETFLNNYDTYRRIMNDDLLPIVYDRVNTEAADEASE